MRWLRLLLLTLFAFALVLLWRMPAGWARPMFPQALHCVTLTGTIWDGECALLSWNDGRRPPLQLTRMHWQVQPLALFKGRLAAMLTVEHAAGTAQGRVTTGRGDHIAVSDLSLNGRIDHALLSALPAGWSGQLEAHGVVLEMQGRQLVALRGEARAIDILDQSGRSAGSYLLTMSESAGPPFTGKLSSSNGPVGLLADLKIAADFSWELDGSVIATDQASPQLQRQLQMLGPPDGQGRRRISVAGTN